MATKPNFSILVTADNLYQPSTSYGIQLQDYVSLSPAVPICETVHVPGRNGDLKFYSGEYENRKAVAHCFVLSEDLKAAYSVIDKYLFGEIGYRKFKLQHLDPHYLYGAITNAAEIKERMQVLAPFDIEWDCKPQRYLFNIPNITLTEAGTVTNPTAFTSEPLIRIGGTGEITLNVGDYTVEVEITNDNYIYLDTETQNAYRSTLNLNNKVVGAFPKLVAGENEISWSGNVTDVRITPRWWEL